MKLLRESMFLKTLLVTVIIFVTYLLYSYLFTKTGFKFSESQIQILLIVAVAGNMFNLLRDIRKKSNF